MVKPETEKSIVQAAEDLVREGIESPTNAQVLERLGKGSLSTVSPVMREWRNRRSEEQATFREMPDPLKEMITGSISHLWVEANRQADKDLEEFREKAISNIRRAEAERDEALMENGKLSKQTHELREKLEEEKDTRQQLENQLQGKEAKLIELTTENKLLLKQVEDLKELTSRLQSELVELAKRD